MTGRPPGAPSIAHSTRDVPIGTLVLENGVPLPGVRMRVETFGLLAPDRGNAILLLPGLNADTHAAARSADDRGGWWREAIGPGLGIDTDLWHVVVADPLGGSHGSTSALSPAPDGRAWADRFPSVTIRDLAAASERLLDGLSLPRWAGVIGLSFGGMQTLELLVTSDRVDRVVVVAAPAATDAEQLVSNALQIDLVHADPAYLAGRYAAAGTRPLTGLGLARRVGMLSYRGAGEIDRRFGRRLQDDSGLEYAAESHSRAHGARFADAFDANAFLTLTAAKNSHDIGRGRGGLTAALSLRATPLLVIAIDSDRLFPLAQQRQITQRSAGSITGREPLTLSSPHGHDAFLIDQEWMGSTIGAFLDGASPALAPPSIAPLTAHA